ncbi:MAG: SDR family oxidoreductase [Gammaproteobacteria bacterium]|nr:SDR family oxidoreductase [Gammaproteobacteria bacterium]MBU1624044.1 SDR family oxidoreductase [Gammaproteobacteria bacterium]MBU1981772.1 SDR family oxidoreductase [Gammaproteobacteria bacterium]
MRILVTGANGFVGSALVAQMCARELAVRCAVRVAGQIDDCADSVAVGGIDAQTNWRVALHDIDVVIHLAARVHVMHESAVDPLAEFQIVNGQGTENLARQAAEMGVKRLVYASSIKVNGEETVNGHVYRETELPVPQDAYGISKWEAEQALHRVSAETGLEVVIVRPPLVYGPGVKGNFAQMLKVLAHGIPLPLASVDNRRSLIYSGNLVDALIACATHPVAAGRTYLVSDGEDISTPELLRSLGKALRRPARLLPFSPALLRSLGRLAGRAGQVERLLGSLQIDSGKIRRELDWKPPFTLQQGLQETAAWYQSKDL